MSVFTSCIWLDLCSGSSWAYDLNWDYVRLKKFMNKWYRHNLSHHCWCNNTNKMARLLLDSVAPSIPVFSSVPPTSSVVFVQFVFLPVSVCICVFDWLDVKIKFLLLPIHFSSCDLSSHQLYKLQHYVNPGSSLQSLTDCSVMVHGTNATAKFLVSVSFLLSLP